MPSRARFDDYVTGFCDGYEQAVHEVVELLDRSGVEDQEQSVDRKVGAVKRALKLFGLIWG